MDLVERLAAHGLNDARTAAAAARGAGWACEQVLGLLEQFEGGAIDGLLRWRPGVLWWQLTRGVPGSEITVPPQEAWQSANAQVFALRRQQQQAAAQADAATEQARRVARTQREREHLEVEVGEILDAIPRAEVLTWESLQASRAWLARRWAEGTPMPAGVVRTIALRTLQEKSVSQEQAR